MKCTLNYIFCLFLSLFLYEFYSNTENKSLSQNNDETSSVNNGKKSSYYNQIKKYKYYIFPSIFAVTLFYFFHTLRHQADVVDSLKKENNKLKEEYDFQKLKEKYGEYFQYIFFKEDMKKKFQLFKDYSSLTYKDCRSFLKENNYVKEFFYHVSEFARVAEKVFKASLFCEKSQPESNEVNHNTDSADLDPQHSEK
jgi:hypothetical protein